MPAALPIDDVLPRLIAAVREQRAAVLVAPPGAGKTTRVPGALRDIPVLAGPPVPPQGTSKPLGQHPNPCLFSYHTDGVSLTEAPPVPLHAPWQ